ncbi:hypothetical protein M2G91_07325, partial [Vibrio vulnificus]|nr:hypothetical protein [Vibrio vulnificus]
QWSVWLYNGNEFEHCSRLSCGSFLETKVLNSIPNILLFACLFRLLLAILAQAGIHPKACIAS